MSEPRRFDVLAEVLARVTIERNGTKLAPVPSPPAVIPRSNNQIVQVLWIMLLERFVDFDGTAKVLLIPPPSDIQVGNFQWAFDVRHYGLLLPKVIVVRMCQEIVPGRHLAVKIGFVDVGENSEIEKGLKRVGGIKGIEIRIGVLRGFEKCSIFETIAQTESPVVMEVVAEKHSTEPPARETVEVARLPKDVNVEISVIAVQ